MPDFPESDRLDRRALSIAEALAHASPGEKAEARRMDEAGAPIFWRQMARLGIEPSTEARWLFYTKLVALLTPASHSSSIHEGGRRFGAVLADGGDRAKPLNTPDAKPFLSEARLARLIAARDDARKQALERIVRMMSRKSPTFDVTDLARFIFARTRREPAASYYTRIDTLPDKETTE